MFNNPIRLLRDPSALLMAGIKSGTDLLSQGINAVTQGAVNKKQRKWNEKMYQWQRQDSLADWHMQNEYNSPSAQMQRLRDAKLNPNLVYGNGADTTAGVPRSADAGSWNPRPATFDLGRSADAGLAGYYDVKLKEAQVNNLETLNTIQIQDAVLRAAQVRETEARTRSTVFDTGLKESLRENSMEVANQTLQKLKADLEKTNVDTQVLLNRDMREAISESQSISESLERIARMKSQNRTDAVQRDQLRANIEILKKEGTLKELEINMRKLGINPSDPTWQRMIAQGVKQLSKLDVPALIRDVSTGSKSHNEAVATLNDRILKLFGVKK